MKLSLRIEYDDSLLYRRVYRVYSIKSFGYILYSPKRGFDTFAAYELCPHYSGLAKPSLSRRLPIFKYQSEGPAKPVASQAFMKPNTT